MMEQNIVYYGDPRLLQRNTATTRLLNIAFLTSVRDTGTEDRNGTMVETGNGRRYMENAIERIVGEMHPPGWEGPSGLTYAGRLAGLVRVVGVFTDDRQYDMRDSSYSVLPEPGRDWIYPLTLTTPDGQLVRDMTYNIPSSFRRLPLVGAEEERRQLKHEFETKVLRRMRRLGGDVLISDHYMARLDYLWALPCLYGRVLNIHPAVTVEDNPHCFRGPTPTADAIARARSGTHTQTGATLHFIGEKIDDGQAIAYVDHTPVFPEDEPQWLRYRNYTGAKLPLFVEGLAYYANTIYPHLDGLRERYNPRPFPNLSKLSSSANGRTHRYENILLS